MHAHSSSNMNGHNNSSLQCTTRVVKVQKFTTIKSDVVSASITNTNAVSNGNGVPVCDEYPNSSKSFVQQRIERLYGPGALGMAFRTRRAMLEKQNDFRPAQEISLEGNESPTNLPSVFRHLRPEFRHQLPVITKRGIGWSNQDFSNFKNATTCKTASSLNNCNVVNNESRVRHIPIQLEDSDKICSSDVPDKKLIACDDKKLELNEKPKLILKSIQKSDMVEDQLNFKKIDLSKNIMVLPSSRETESSVTSVKKQVPQDGHHFLKIAEVEVSLLLPQVEKIEKELESCGESMTEDVKGKLLAATGKTKLLISQKVEQFKGLCHKNIINSSAEEFPTTNEDLAGFWDMVSIQVDHVKDLLAEVHELRLNNWQDVPKQETVCQKKNTSKGTVFKIKSSNVSSEEKRQKELAKLKANDERRKAMREALIAKRKAAASINNLESDQIEIFVQTK